MKNCPVQLFNCISYVCDSEEIFFLVFLLSFLLPPISQSLCPDSSRPVQHLPLPTLPTSTSANNSRRVSISSDISLEMTNGKEQKTIWDKSDPGGEGPNDDKVVKNGGT